MATPIGPRCASDSLAAPVGGDNETDDRRRLVRRHRQRRRRNAQPRTGVPQLVIRLRVDPADDAQVGVSKIAFHLAADDALAHCNPIGVAVERRPMNGGCDFVVMAIALRPFGIVRECGSALMVEEVEIVFDASRRQPFDANVQDVPADHLVGVIRSAVHRSS